MFRWRALLLLAAGCVSADRVRLDDALRQPPQPDTLAHDRYVIQCPDRLLIRANGPAPWTVERAVGVDGRIGLPNLGTLRVQGQTVPEVRQAIARARKVPAETVQIQVVDYLSQQVFVQGEVAGVDRAVPYQGPETVLDVLRRAGGLKPGAALTEVRIVRGHVAEGRAPEVFDVDLRAILLQNDPQTNVRVEPFDQIYIGTSRQAEFVSGLPPVFRPTWAWLLGIRRTPQTVKPEP
jgi:protein involved in polysaccharide export with SLBB domain